MTICFIFRDKRVGGYSIERVFRTVKGCLPKDVTSIEHIVNSKTSVFHQIWALSKIKADVYHITGDVHYLSLALIGKRSVLTIHDFGHLDYTLSGLKKRIYKLIWYTIPVAIASRITTVSTFSLKRLLAHYPKAVSKAQVIYNPIDEKFKPSPKTKAKAPLQILQIGQGKHKNIETLMAAAKATGDQLILIRPKDVHIATSLDSQGISYEWHQGVSSEELKALYSKSDVVFFASTYEGFGLPIIEAQTTGRPVIVSNQASLQEIAGTDEYSIRPDDVNGLIELFNQFRQPEVYRQAVNQGFHNIARFDPTEITMQYVSLYQDLVND